MKKSYRDLPYNGALIARARQLRKAGYLTEVLLWKELRKKKFLNLDFDRQRVIGNYIVDFFCAARGVVIEVDGLSHYGRELYDQRRDRYLQSLGLTVIHIRASDVRHALPRVMKYLREHSSFK